MPSEKKTQQQQKKTLNIPGALCLTKTTPEVYRVSDVDSIGDKMLRGMNSGLYFQTNKVLLFGEVLILKPKKKKETKKPNQLFF